MFQEPRYLHLIFCRKPVILIFLFQLCEDGSEKVEAMLEKLQRPRTETGESGAQAEAARPSLKLVSFREEDLSGVPADLLAEAIHQLEGANLESTKLTSEQLSAIYHNSDEGRTLKWLLVRDCENHLNVPENVVINARRSLSIMHSLNDMSDATNNFRQSLKYWEMSNLLD